MASPDTLTQEERENISNPLDFLESVVSATPETEEVIEEEKPKKRGRKPLSEKVEEQQPEEQEEVVVPDEPDEPETPEKGKPKKEEEPVKDEDDQGIDEEDYVQPFMEEFSSRYGWDIPEDKMPKTFDEFFAFVEDVVAANSKPDFASDDVKAFDDFIRAGGNKLDFFASYQKRVEVKDIDLTKPASQEKVLREYYAEKGLSPAQIERHIDRARQSDEMEDDAKEAHEELKKIYQKRQEDTVKQQKELEEMEQKKVIHFRNSVITAIDKNDQYYGLPLTTKEKAKLVPYIFQEGRDGKTQFQKDYEADPIGYTIFTALTYMQRNELSKVFDSKANKKAVTTLKEKLDAMNKSRRTISNVVEEKPDTDGDWLNDFKITTQE